LNDTEHAPVGLWPTLWLIEPNAVNGGDQVVINAAERGDQGRDTVSLSSIFIAPGATRMESENRAGKIVRKLEGARGKVSFRDGAAWVNAAIPDVKRPMYAVQVIFGALSSLGFDGVTVKSFSPG
jgi:hypothetical protein